VLGRDPLQPRTVDRVDRSQPLLDDSQGAHAIATLRTAMRSRATELMVRSLHSLTRSPRFARRCVRGRLS
jgi:hypothetical protein